MTANAGIHPFFHGEIPLYCVLAKTIRKGLSPCTRILTFFIKTTRGLQGNNNRELRSISFAAQASCLPYLRITAYLCSLLSLAKFMRASNRYGLYLSETPLPLSGLRESLFRGKFVHRALSAYSSQRNRQHHQGAQRTCSVRTYCTQTWNLYKYRYALF